ncbi:uncharacterized protein ATC70_004924 [Mucor velutinosus]|uniref:Uncharacterized protein n=1 Tax=Mucor velutinosus TaxID=708070 RepID=A0AAN7D5Z4_9FUNG|nr:hypothetical protein ATC70_004924 [Mucor velutinosus]
MFANAYLMLSAVALLLLVHHTEAYWTVREKYAPRKDGTFWAELTKIEFNGVDSSEIKCRVNTNPFQDKNSIIYGKKSGFHGCDGVEKVSLHGNNRVLHYLTVLDSEEVLNCVLAEKTSVYKEYICGNATPAALPVGEVPVSIAANVASSTTNSGLTVSITTVTYIPSFTNGVACVSGYSGQRNGGGATGACCNHSDDCLDTCVQGVCGITP